MKKQWRIGMIGAGMMARQHIRQLHETGRARVTAVAAHTRPSAKKTGAEFGIERTFTDFKALCRLPDIDAVVIASPPHTHAPAGIAALTHGKHVLLEKPASPNRRDLNRLLACAKKYPACTVLEASCRHSVLQPKFRFIRKIIEKGTLGTVYHIRHQCGFRQSRPGIEYNPGAHWFCNKKLAGGGPSIDLGVYDLAFHLGLFDNGLRLRSVSAVSRNHLDRRCEKPPVFTVEEHFAAFLAFSNGLTCSWERANNVHADIPHQTTIYGTAGGLQFAFWSWDPPEVRHFYVDRNGTGKARVKTLTVPMRNHTDDNLPLLHHFLDCIEGKAEPLMPLEKAAAHLDIIFRVLEAAGRNRRGSPSRKG